MKESAVFNPSTAKRVRTAEAKLADTNNPLFKIKFESEDKTPETPNEYHAIEIDANGSGGSKLIVYLNIGASATSYDQYQFSAYATGVADPSSVDASPTHTQCTTLGPLLTAMNALAGVKAYRLHAPADYSLDTDDFIDLTEVEFGQLWKECLYRDASEILVCQCRIGVPEVMDGGNIELLQVDALIDSASGTDCTFKVSQDPNEVDATKETELAFTRYVPDNTWTTLWDFTDSDNPPVFKGPVICEATSVSSMAVNAVFRVMYRSAEY